MTKRTFRPRFASFYTFAIQWLSLRMSCSSGERMVLGLLSNTFELVGVFVFRTKSWSHYLRSSEMKRGCRVSTPLPSRSILIDSINFVPWLIHYCELLLLHYSTLSHILWSSILWTWITTDYEYTRYNVPAQKIKISFFVLCTTTCIVIKPANTQSARMYKCLWLTY